MKVLGVYQILIGVAFALTGVAQETHADTNTVYACVNNLSSAVKIVAADTVCHKNETMQSWNIVGPQGTMGPAGPQGPAGADGTNGQDGADGLDGFIVYEIGDVGPAGGWVFYVTDDGLHGLEAAPIDQGRAAWGCYGTNLPGAEGTAIGAGARNTDDIIRGCPPAGMGEVNAAQAAALADDYISPSGYFDWYLPSKDELNEMYLNIGPGNLGNPNVGGFESADVYWSSSEILDDRAFGQYFAGGYELYNYKDSLGDVVRAIRAF